MLKLDGTAFTDTVTGTVAKDGAADAAVDAGTSITHLANGKYRVALAQTDTDAVALGFSFIGTGASPKTANFITTALNPQDGVRGGQSALPNADANTQNGIGVLDVNGHLPGNVLAWGSTPGAVKVGASSTLPDMNLMAWQDRNIGGAANMIETGTGSDRWTEEALIQGPVTSTTGLALEATSQAIKTQTDKMLFNGSNYIRSHVETLEATALGSIAKNIWDYLETAITLAGSIGLKLKTNVDALISSRSTFNAASDTVTADLVNDAIKATTIEAGALNGKGDWNSGKTGYSLVSDQSGVTIGTVTDVTNEVSADMTAINGNQQAAINLDRGANAQQIGAVNDASATTTQFITDLPSTVNDTYKGRILTFATGTVVAKQAATITLYDGTTKRVTMAASELTSAPNNGDTFYVS